MIVEVKKITDYLESEVANLKEESERLYRHCEKADGALLKAALCTEISKRAFGAHLLTTILDNIRNK